MEKKEVPPLEFSSAVPTNLHDVFEAQVMNLISLGFSRQVGMKESAYKDVAMSLCNKFVYSNKLANYGLDRVLIVDYRVDDMFLTSATGGVYLFVGGYDRLRLLEGVLVPKDFSILQFGVKYKGNPNPRVAKKYFSTHVDGLIAYIQYGKPLLKEAGMIFPGVVNPDNRRLWLICHKEGGALPALGAGYPGNTPECCGTLLVARSKI